MEIQRLSSAKNTPTESNGLIVVGSFAPVHEGHFDAIRSAERALAIRDESVSANVFVPNSDSYVLGKVNDDKRVWDFPTRVSKFLNKDSGTIAPSYVDDLSGIRPPKESISEAAIETASKALGIQACNFILVVGTDQLASMEPHLETNKAICVLRPGYEETLKQYINEEWFTDAVDSGRYILTERENIEKDIASRTIRQELSLT